MIERLFGRDKSRPEREPYCFKISDFKASA
jgi:hypothetical protein